MTIPAEGASARIERHEGWGELILSRPERRNALVGPMVSELRAGLADLLSGGARAIVLRGDGGCFCSGLDVEAFAADPAPAWRAEWAETWIGFHRALYDCPAVIIGALERFAINGGSSPALACDLLVAGEGAYLLVGEAAIGMHAPMNIAWLRLRATEAIAAQLLLAAERVPAAELLRLGLAYRVVADSAVVETAQAMAAKLAGYRGDALAAIKRSLRRAPPAGADMFAAVQATGFQSAPPARVGGG
jgi:enoyl-CoA hydratase/carnithine racemase